MTTMIASQAHAQKEYTTISKNINPEAQSLYHDLSPQGDSLYLKSESIFYKVTFLNSLDRKVYTFNPPVLEGTIPLHDIIVGDYTVLVYKKDRIIVFHITRLLEIDIPSEAIAIAELSKINVPLEFSSSSNMDLKEKPISKIIMNEIKKGEEFQLGQTVLKLASNDNYSSRENGTILNITPYNISSVDRSQMQSREEYRRTNLRPNGKPF